MRAYCSIVTILEYSKELRPCGPADGEAGGAEMTPARDDD